MDLLHQILRTQKISLPCTGRCPAYIHSRRCSLWREDHCATSARLYVSFVPNRKSRNLCDGVVHLGHLQSVNRVKQQRKCKRFGVLWQESKGCEYNCGIMESIYRTLQDFLSNNESVAVATVIEVRGSAPREVGAKMIVHPSGRIVGTIGGGYGEANVIQAAQSVIKSGQATELRIELTHEISMESSGICGGVMQIYIERWQSGWEELDALVQSIRMRESVALVTIIRSQEQTQVGNRAVIWAERTVGGGLELGEVEDRVLADAQNALRQRQHRILRYPDQGLEVFVEVQRRPLKMIIVGSGHVAVPLAEIAAMCDFGVTVIDDRPEFANKERFPGADQIIVADLQQAVRDIDMDEDTYLVLVTRGHTLDVACLIEIIDRPLAYIGMIGSKRRVRGVFALLEQEEGIPKEKLKRVYAPIGLPLAARTPAEIAVSIMGEVINVFRGGTAVSFSGGQQEQARGMRSKVYAKHLLRQGHPQSSVGQGIKTDVAWCGCFQTVIYTFCEPTRTGIARLSLVAYS